VAIAREYVAIAREY